MVISAALIAQALLAQAPAPPPKQEPPVIRTTLRLVQVSVIVRDKSGTPVTGLTRDDFVLLDNGQPQRISVSSMEARRAETASPPVAPLPRNTFTNRLEQRGDAAPTSVTVILFDALNTLARDHAYGKNQVVRFLSQLRPTDRMALYAFSSQGIRVLQDFTADPAPLLTAMTRYRTREENQQANTGPEPPDSGMAIFDAAFENILKTQANFYLRDRVTRTVDALVAIANHLSSIPGRKNLVWISGSFPISFGYERLRAGERGGGGSGGGGAGGSGEGEQSDGLRSGAARRGGRVSASATERSLPQADPDLLKPPEQGVFLQELERAARAMNQAGLAIYPVDARGLVATPPSYFNPAAAAKNLGPTMTQWAGVDRQTIDVMNVLAERTGGRAFYNTNDIQGSVRRALDDGLATYELAYYPTHNQWDGKFREISVRVKRLGVEVRHRRGYFAVGNRPAEEARQAELDAAAASPLESAVLGLTARLEPVSGNEPGTWNVRVEMDAREVSLKKKDGRWVGAVAVVLVQKKPDGSTVTSSSHRVDLGLAPQTYERLLRDGIKLTKKVKLEPDAFELRILVRDATSGATGSVHVPLSQLAAVPKQ